MFSKAARAAAVLAVLATSVSACSNDDDAKASDDARIVIGVSDARPGLSAEKADGSFSGFDVDMASYVARRLGWSDRQVTFRALPDDDREQALSTGEVDMVVSAYTITTERAKAVDFAGPYLVAGQDLLVARKSEISGPRSLNGKTVCGTRGSAELARVQEAEFSRRAVLKGADDIAACVDLLLAGRVDAVTTDDAVLAGFAKKHATRLRLVGSPFSTDYYGIGLPQGSPDVAVVNDILQRAIDDGTWQASFDRHLGASGFAAPLPPVPSGTRAR
ncbi:glutamate ABC transporter substrate-binding protein [Nocardioides plantarum]|uniref:Glutamate ABC transporter substrate-binding protein n=1 Tax=Nocardioides plantarum TaxID=29299 RepID=A0ABV5K825_9ACTN|nr:glutamate ABC transporter substrate-binding protein [Nocardioides plantarum]